MSAEEDVRSAAFQALLEIAVDASEDTEHRIAAAAVVLGNTTDPYEAPDGEWTITVDPTNEDHEHSFGLAREDAPGKKFCECGAEMYYAPTG